MNHDYEISRKIWEGVVPVEFVLDSDVTESSRAFYTMVQRTSYFPLVLPKALAFFSSLCEDAKLDLEHLYLEFNRVQLKLYYPVGVLYDLHKNDDALPWTISVKIKDSSSDFAGSVGRDVLQSMFIQTIKEADYLRRKAEVIQSMKPHEHKQLWNAFSHGNFDEFWNVNRKLAEESKEEFLRVPVRFYKTGEAVRQISLCPREKDGLLLTLEDALTRLEGGEEFVQKVSAISHGISLPLTTPLLWMVQNLAYPDNFVHIVLIGRKL